MRLNSNIKGVKVKPIPNYPEYLASFDGRVYSTKLHRWLSTNPHKIFGYLQVHLRKKTHGLNRVIFKPRGKTPLSIEIRRKIKAEYLKGNTTLQKLSHKYGRAHSVIRRIVYETK